MFNQSQQIELLAPARDLKVGKVAIDAGADAVYIGAPRFGARQAAGNSIADIAELCGYAHIFDCRVWVTVNTLLHDDEIADAVDMIWQLYEAGADGILIQDLRLLSYELPPLRLHASTQCDNRTTEQVLRLQEMGFKRVVLARELNPEQIKEISDNTDIELEVFVHGALCVSYSGRCYMSEYVTGRSANRGCCAQLCRYRYDLLDKDMKMIEHDKYALSLLDMDRSAHLLELLESGATSFKIEGRLKDENYVRNIVAYYRGKLDAIFAANPQYKRASKGNVYIDFNPNPEKTFHRGATDYFFPVQGKIANWQTPASTGEEIGVVFGSEQTGRSIDINTSTELHNGDGLTIGNLGFSVNGARQIAPHLFRVVPSTRHSVPVGVAVYRNYDKQFSDTLAKSKTCRRLPVDIVFTETDRGFRLSIGDMFKEFEYEKTPARNGEQALNNIRSQLSKLGDTPYEASSISVEISQPWFIPVSVLNTMRRETIAGCRLQTASNRSQTASNRLRTRLTRKEEIGALMTCRYCILREMGICRKQVASSRLQPAGRREPAYLRSGKNIFALHFDCKKCEMSIYPADVNDVELQYS